MLTETSSEVQSMIFFWLSSNVTRCPVQPRTPDDGYMLTETSSEVQTMTF